MSTSARLTEKEARAHLGGIARSSVRCHGHKTAWRNRTIKITEAWTLPYIRAALEGLEPSETVFHIGRTGAIRAHHRAVKALGLKHSTLHDWRHTYAVNALRRGEKATVVAHQLGHSNAYLVWTRYGKFVPNASDYQTQALTAETTTTAQPEDS